jgi:hypothetical protein
MDPDPDPAIVIDLKDATKKLIFNTNFSAFYFLKVHLHHFSKIKTQKESQNSRNQCYSYYFCMMIEGSGSRAGSGSIPLTSGSGSGRPKKHVDDDRRIRIRNTAMDKELSVFTQKKLLLGSAKYRLRIKKPILDPGVKNHCIPDPQQSF